jgi:diguanylate cyclase (GGDEF)-like protein/PAS domain S-box-containing protein
MRRKTPRPGPERDTPEDLLVRVAMGAAPDGIVLVDRHGTILVANQTMATLSGYSVEELRGQSVSIFLPPQLREKHAAHIRSYFSQPSKRAMGTGLYLWLARPDGSTVPVDVALGHSTVYDGTAVAFVRDVSEMRRLQSHIHYQATHDTLTGLLNRWQFNQNLEQRVAESARHGRPMTLLLIDLDDFKIINDSYGHAAGDQALQEVARRLKGCLRAADTLARLGGDEFTVLLTHLSQPGDARQVADKLLQVLNQPCQVNGFNVNLCASIGMASLPDDADNAVTLLRYADIAMYHAKESGRGQLVAYEASMGKKVAEKNLLHDRLKQAIGTHALSLHYQPQIDMATGRMVGVEALLRWNDEQLGGVAPGRFIPIAEASGLILPLGDWVLETACRQAAAWAQQGMPLRIAVNLSAQQLRQPQLAERLQEQLLRHAVPHGLIDLEIIEADAMADPAQAQLLLTRLHALGVGVTLDDFGTGHSSLTYLKQLPISRIKLDRSFICTVLHSQQDAALVCAVIALTHTLGLKVVAEGVEEEAQVRFLEAQGCDIFQGWFFSRAVPAPEIAALFTTLQAPATTQKTIPLDVIQPAPP